MVQSLEPGRFEERFSVKGADVVLYFDEKDPETGDMKNVYLCVEGRPQGLVDEDEPQDAGAADAEGSKQSVPTQGRDSIYKRRGDSSDSFHRAAAVG